MSCSRARPRGRTHDDDEQLLRRHGITLLHLPTQDVHALQRTMLHEGVRWVRPRLDAGHAPLDALALAKRQRSKVSPSPAQLAAFLVFREEWHAAHRPSWSPPTVEALAWIACSHLRGAHPHARQLHAERPGQAARASGEDASMPV
jgi:hypothetical protein